MIHVFIVNPYAGKKTFADDLRSRLADYSRTHRNFKYFVFNTRYRGYETELTREICKCFENEKLRIYCCGGSGTLRHAINGVDDLEKREIAFYPCGLTNDFLKVFGDDEKKFRELENLIEGEVINIDYIKSNHGIALNTVSLGLDSLALKRFEEDYRFLSVFGKQVPYNLSLLYAAFAVKPQIYEVQYDDKSVSGWITQLLVGNGVMINGNLRIFKDADVTDGKLQIRYFLNWRRKRIPKALSYMIAGQMEEIDRLSTSAECRRVIIRREDHVPFAVNFDGELVPNIPECEIEVVTKGLQFVVPKGVVL